MYEPLTKSINKSNKRNGQKQPENSFIMLFWGIWAPSNGPKKVDKA
jgi:hypothetical protein